MHSALSSNTLAYYDSNAAAYADSTWHLDVAPIRARFVAQLPAGARVLDAGCGSGRDALAFHRLGFEVVAFDGSAAMVEQARARSGLPVLHLRFDEMSWDRCFDGVWAMSSLTHLKNEAQLDDALARCHRALRPGGVLFASLREGDAPSTDPKGRDFFATTTERLRAKLESAERPWQVHDVSVSDSVLAPEVRWVNVLARAH